MNVGYGLNIDTPLSIATKWSKPANTNFKKVNPSTMFGLFGTIGSLGGILLPFFLSILIDQSGQGWYSWYFYVIVAMMVVSAIAVPVVDYQVKRKQGESFFKNALTFFGIKDETRYLSSNQASIEELPDTTNDKVYVDAIL